MPPSTFDALLQLIGKVIERKVTLFRDPISAHDPLAITAAKNERTHAHLARGYYLLRTTLQRLTTSRRGLRSWPFRMSSMAWRSMPQRQNTARRQSCFISSSSWDTPVLRFWSQLAWAATTYFL
ncbi:unnamed protein product [Ixodes persulcatus]